MRYFYWTILISAFIISCKNHDRVPGGILPPAKMQVVMNDLMSADQFINGYVLNRDTSVNKKDRSTQLYQQVFRIHQISRETFEQSFDYYRAHPALLKEVMDSLSVQPDEAPTKILDAVPDTSKSSSMRGASHNLNADTLKRVIQKIEMMDTLTKPVIKIKPVRDVKADSMRAAIKRKALLRRFPKPIP